MPAKTPPKAVSNHGHHDPEKSNYEIINADYQQCEYLRTDDMEPYTGIAGSTWAKRRMSGNSPPYIKCGKLILYRRRDVDDWMQKNLRNSTSDMGGSHANNN